MKLSLSQFLLIVRTFFFNLIVPGVYVVNRIKTKCMCDANFVCGIFFFIKELPIEQSCAHFLQVKVAFIENQLPKLSEIILPSCQR